MDVHIPSPLHSYTKKPRVQCDGATLVELLDNLDRTYPGIKFRMIDEQGDIRQHIKIYVNREPVTHTRVGLGSRDVVHILAALSGG